MNSQPSLLGLDIRTAPAKSGAEMIWRRSCLQAWKWIKVLPEIKHTRNVPNKMQFDKIHLIRFHEYIKYSKAITWITLMILSPDSVTWKASTGQWALMRFLICVGLRLDLPNGTIRASLLRQCANNGADSQSRLLPPRWLLLNLATHGPQNQSAPPNQTPFYHQIVPSRFRTIYFIRISKKM